MRESLALSGERQDQYSPRILGALTVEELYADEEMNDIVIPEADDEIVSTLRRRPAGWVLLGCGDDRGMSPASSRRLREEGLPADRPYLRYFGGSIGMARVSLVAAIAQYGPKILEKLSPDKGFMRYSSEFSNVAEERTEVIATAHSAVTNELNDKDLNPASSAPLACAYAFNVGEVSHIAGHNETIHRLSASEYSVFFGPGSAVEAIDKVAEANREFTAREFGDNPREFSITRSDLLSSTIPTMLVEGEHASSIDTFLLANFSVDRLSDPQAAQEISRPYYGIDFTQTAEVIMKSLPELKLDPEIVFATMILDVGATRTALAAHDGPANPERISIVRYGDPETAIEYLKSLQKQPVL